MTFRFARTALGGILLVLLLGAWPALAQEPASPVIPATTRIHRVDDFVTQSDLRDGLTLSDRDAPLVTFSHTLHATAGVSCDQCHHLGVQDATGPACATCHKGAPGVDTMHTACISCHRSESKGPVACADCHTARQASLAGFVRFDLYDIARGPLFIAAWVLFALGFAWRMFRFTRLTRPTGTPAVIALPRPTADDRALLARGRSGIGRAALALRRWVRRTIFGTNPVMGVVSLLFHVALFLTPLLLPAHNILFQLGLGVSLPSLPEPLMDKVTLALLAVGAFFLLRRIVLPRVRALSTVRDYLVLLLVAAPFVTAYMAYHQYLDYRTVLVTHMMVGDLLIAAIPFTKLGHMPYLIFARFFMAGEYAWKPGNRRW